MLRVFLITKEGEELFGELTIEDKAYFVEKEIKEIDCIVTPTFFNSHVHLGDSVAKDPEFMDLEKLVGPNGYKFRILKETNRDEIVSCMKNSIDVALNSGTTNLAEFREGGIEGLKLLNEADEMNVCIKLARPSSIEEAELMLKQNANGFGMSSVRDHEFSFLEELRDIARKRNVIFAIHAGERDNDDVERALSLEPDLLIHMNMADVKSLKAAMDEEIPIVSCLRSNAFFNLLNNKNYDILSDYRLWLIGTDNVMIVSPNIVSEMNFASYIIKKDKKIFCAVTRGFDVFSCKTGLILFHTKKNLYKANSIRSIVRRANANDILQVLHKELVLE